MGRVFAPSAGDPSPLSLAEILDQNFRTIQEEMNGKLDSKNLALQVKTITVSAGQSTGTVTVPTSAVILGIYPAGNQDQFVDNVSISGTTLTVTLAANATATNTYKVTLLTK